VPLAVVFSFQSLAVLYPARAMPLQSTPGTRLVVSHTLIGLASISCWLLLGWLWSSALAAISGLDGAPERFASAILVFAAAGALLHATSILAHYLLIEIERSREAEHRALEAKLLARGAELRLLRAQLNPHFLFNSLNSISALAGSDPPAARRMCLNLAAFFRQSLGVGGRSSIPLEEEFELAGTYLAIEAERFGSRLRVRSEAEPDTRRFAVPPLVLQPLVENAVHHGIATLVVGGEIRLSARHEGEDILLSVENPCDPDRAPSHAEGLGLGNVRSRISALYGGAASLEVHETRDRYRVELRLPGRPAEDSR
jgi:two-component system sensor histidine kinase AlgZ